MFNRMDDDGSGVLEPHEVQALCSQLHQLVPTQLSSAEMAGAVQRLDRDGNGEVDFAEFFAWYEQEMTEAKMRDRPLYSEVKGMFRDMDTDGSGELDIGAICVV
jgi:Ca2+-binding EF-hand superfamily protein